MTGTTTTLWRITGFEITSSLIAIHFTMLRRPVKLEIKLKTMCNVNIQTEEDDERDTNYHWKKRKILFCLEITLIHNNVYIQYTEQTHSSS